MQHFSIFSTSASLYLSRCWLCFSLITFPFCHAIAEVNQRNTTSNVGQSENTAKEGYPSYSNSQIIAPQDSAIDSLNLPQTDHSLEFDNNLTPEENADIWKRIKDGYAMPDNNTSLVKRHEKSFVSQPNLINNIMDRSQKYIFHIVEEVQSRGMPTEIALLPMIESAYNPSAYSTAKAAGIWQFIPSTGKTFGLKQNWWVDNRRNITFATDAALSYLQKLHVMFGAWDLALAAYNAGEGTVRRAIEKNQKLGKPTDYASLDLPKETENYVPKLQAIKNIMTNPANYGIKLKSIENKAYFTTVTAPSQIDAKLVAELAEISFEEFIALNPGFNRPVITATSDTQELLLPVTAVDTFYQNLSTYDKPLVNWKPLPVKAGELISNVAAKNDISVEKLRKINHLSSLNRFTKSTIILVPSKAPTEKVAIAKIQNDGQTSPQNLTTDSSNVAASSESKVVESDVDISQLQNAGNIDIKNLESLQNIQQNEASSEAKASEPKQGSAITHTVKNGETLEKIAKKYKISTKTLICLNHLKKNQVKAGQKLVIKPASNVKKNIQQSKDKQNINKNNKTKSSKTKLKQKPTKNKQAGKMDTKKTKAKNLTKVKQKASIAKNKI